MSAAARETAVGRDRGLGVAFFAPYAAWALAFSANYLLESWICASGRRWVLVAIDLAAIAVALTAAVLAGARMRGPEPPPEDRVERRRRVFATVAFLGGLFLSAAILALAIPGLGAPACE